MRKWVCLVCGFFVGGGDGRILLPACLAVWVLACRLRFHLTCFTG